MTRSVAREVAFQAIDSERKHQDAKFGAHLRPIAEECFLVQAFATKALAAVIRPNNTTETLGILREIAGLATRALETHAARGGDVPFRKPFVAPPVSGPRG